MHDLSEIVEPKFAAQRIDRLDPSAILSKSDTQYVLRITEGTEKLFPSLDEPRILSPLLNVEKLNELRVWDRPPHDPRKDKLDPKSQRASTEAH
jgi:hypothetical protein